MTEQQREDLLIELSLYDSQKLLSMVADFVELYQKAGKPESIYDYLAERIEIRGYWEKIGLQ